MSDWTNVAFALMSADQKQVCITNEHKSSLTVFNLTKILFSRQDLIFSPGIFSKNNHQFKWSEILKIFVQTILIFLYFYSFDICYANFFIFTLKTFNYYNEKTIQTTFLLFSTITYLYFPAMCSQWWPF